MSIFSSIFNKKSKPISSEELYSEDDITSLLQKVRKLEIKTKGLSNHIFSGEYHSAFKGRGMSFSEVREYSYGDDVRNIDWNVTARFRAPFIKVFEEERELTLMLLVDISSSSLFGTHSKNKKSLISELCSVLAFSAISNNDKVGVIFFSNKIERYIAPKKGKSHVLFIIRELLSSKPEYNKQTNIEEALRYLNAICKKRSIAFLFSDFYSFDYQKALQISAKKHDLIGVHVYDELDKNLPDVGAIEVQDSETFETMWLNTSSKSVREAYSKRFLEHEKQTLLYFNKSNTSLISMSTNEDYVKKLQLFFKSRSH
ncbi:MAG: DUF58 domain-containing protein [Chitinophagaceae bacterium]